MIASLTFLVSTFAESPDFKGVVFEAPTKWSQKTIQGAMMISPADLKPDEIVSIVFSEARPIEKNLRQDFVNYIGGIESKLKVISKGKLTTWKRDSLDVLKMRGSIDGGGRGTFTALYQIVGNGKTAVACSIIFKGESLPARYQKPIASLLMTIRPKGSAKPKSEKQVG
ncbi:MAG: hypothetical protein WCI55_11365 [Armatimonadota bacterium]